MSVRDAARSTPACGPGAAIEPGNGAILPRRHGPFLAGSAASRPRNQGDRPAAVPLDLAVEFELEQRRLYDPN
ncbi:hypothetical protein MEX01_14090 [Methylorubrum extorquens]|nr:hypothetical protein MEX01_14090 [Methylorubrum extorquens]